MTKFEEHLNRIMAAVHLEQLDRIPFMSSGSALNAALTGLPLSQYCADMRANCEANLKGIQLYSDPDGVQVTIFQPSILTTCWFGKMEVPGRDLPENELWQMHEEEIIKQEDYDDILENGFEQWFQRVMAERLGNPMQYCQEFLEFMGPSIGIFAENGYPCFCGANFYTPFEMFCGGRTLYQFFSDDLLEIPDKVEKVFDIVQEFNMKNWEMQLANPQTRPIALWIGAWRGTPDLLSPALFERFSWKYMRQLIDLCLSYQVIPLMHLDSDWTRGMQYFKDYVPKGKVILSLDGKTDIFKAKEVVKDHCCLMGDVPASLLSFGKPEDVDAYCKKLITECGPTGYIMSSGCDAPYNSKLENLKTMADSVMKYH